MVDAPFVLPLYMCMQTLYYFPCIHLCIFSFSDDSDSSNEFKGKSSRVSITLSGCEYISTNPAKEVSY
jgi:hypothetical protein